MRVAGKEEIGIGKSADGTLTEFSVSEVASRVGAQMRRVSLLLYGRRESRGHPVGDTHDAVILGIDGDYIMGHEQFYRRHGSGIGDESVLLVSSFGPPVVVACKCFHQLLGTRFLWHGQPPFIDSAKAWMRVFI